MRIIPALPKSSRAWWWGFGLLIAVPALALAFLGLWAVRAERIEREQQIRRQQTQVAQLADGAIATVLARLETELSRAEADRPGSADELPRPEIPIFSFDQQGLLTFPHDRVYFGDFGLRPAALPAFPDWSSSVRQLIEQARAAEAQQRLQEAVTLYQRVIRAESKLSDWAEFSIARARNRSGAATSLMRSQGLQYAEGLTPQDCPWSFLPVPTSNDCRNRSAPPFFPWSSK